MSTAPGITANRTFQDPAQWLLAAAWLGLVLCPALLLMFVALGQWRFPLDVCVVAAVIPLLRKRIGTWLLWTAYYLIVGLFILHCFNLSLGSLPFYAEFAGSIPAPKLALKLTVVAAALVPVVGTRFVPGIHRLRWHVAILAALIIVTGASLRALPGAPLSVRYALPAPSLTLAASYLAEFRIKESLEHPSTLPPPRPPLDAALSAAPLPNQLYLFTVESWADGAQGHAGLAEAARSYFGDRLLEVNAGFRPSYGATLQGELRELCGIEQPIHRLSDVPFSNCLPNRLKARGYETVAGHGYQSMFYLRTALYPRLGFKQRLFLEDLERSVPSCAGAFVGLCDLALLDRLLDASSPRHRRLVYQMTLQSHEPVTSEVLAEYGISSDETGSVAVAHAFVEGAMQRLASSRGAECGALVYFVGDHPPPSLKASGEFKEEVSYLLLRLAPTDRCELP